MPSETFWILGNVKWNTKKPGNFKVLQGVCLLKNTIIPIILYNL